MKVQVSNTNTPNWRDITVKSQVPTDLKCLEILAKNLWWSWNNEAINLFKSIDKDLWKSVHENPVLFLQRIGYEKLEEITKDKQIMRNIQDVYDKFEKYLQVEKRKDVPSISYFSMEYGLSHVLKIYSGGLGILAGDYLKEASDSNIDMTAVGFLYRYGYFTQTLSMDGQQIANYEAQNFNQLPIEQLTEQDGKPVDKDEWLMTPQTVNAYYNPTTNEICFPAAILQPPFFDMNADDAMNYGAIGVVIGHEMTHGFDDQGRQYDKDGNLKDWWTEEDAKKFEERAQVMVNFFDSIEVAPGVHANGSLTLGENIADHGGLQVSFQAFKNATEAAPLEIVDGFTPEQRFFLAYANVWAGNIRPEEILRLTKLDPHSLGKWRVDGALPHIQNWYEAFKITEQDSMFVPKEKRVSIW